VRAFFAAAGRIDHLVLCLSGAEGGGEFASLDLRALRRGFEGKFWPHVEIAQAAIPALSKNGSITFVTAMSANAAIPGTSGLAAINGALNAMVPPLAKELKPIRVNAVAPGVTDTPWWNAYSPEAKAKSFESFAAAIPLGRVGEPDEVARAIQHFIENSYLTGIVLPCDGGLHL
jgi:NAD(P)-dependent dehydrogenase (short-subunit alcohol dehydrogenase family)